MFRFLAKRFVFALIQVVLVGTVVFGLLHLLPGDPVLVILGSERTPDPETIEAVRAKLGLDRPLVVQYGDWISGLFTGDLGTSLSNNQPVWDRVMARLPRTIELVGAAMLGASVLGILFGMVAALNWNRLGDRLMSLLAVVGISTPVYVVGTLLVLFFAVQLRWLPNAGYTAPGENFSDFLRKLILPAVALSFGPLAIITRTTRSVLLEVRFQNYIRTARAKGLHEMVVVRRHMLRNALIPVVTIIGIQMGSLLGGTVIVEHIFNWPGLSTLLIQSIQRRDYPVVQGIVLVIAALFILINLFVDILYGFLDPRVRQA
jgi:peptide/nickel transport system permease protein